MEKKLKLREYKGRAKKMKDYLHKLGVDDVEICLTDESFIRGSDVIVSAITVATDVIGKDEWYDEGVLVVPIHTRGFQNCDLFFDKIFADDKAHVSDFNNFSKFRSFNEFGQVLKGEVEGRTSNSERILSYNIGISLHDLYLSRKVYEILNNDKLDSRNN